MVDCGVFAFDDGRGKARFLGLVERDYYVDQRKARVGDFVELGNISQIEVVRKL